VLLDRTHTLKVQQIQKEYQDFMERIRNKAQVSTIPLWGVPLSGESIHCNKPPPHTYNRVLHGTYGGGICSLHGKRDTPHRLSSSSRCMSRVAGAWHDVQDPQGSAGVPVGAACVGRYSMAQSGAVLRHQGTGRSMSQAGVFFADLCLHKPSSTQALCTRACERWLVNIGPSCQLVQ